MTTAAARRLAIACVVLAAGESRRLGSPKQLLRRRGRALLLHAVAAARAALPGAPIAVVLGARAQTLRSLLRRRAPYALAVHNARWREGLASSLQAGLTRVERRTGAVLVLLVDQPHVDAAALRRLVRAWRAHPRRPAAAHYLGRAGVPAILPRGTWRRVRALEGDAGARSLLQGADVTLVPMPEAAVDIDTPADAASLR